MSKPDSETSIPKSSGPIVPDVVLDPLNIEEEGLFARDIDGQLVRLEESTADDYDKDVSLKIDGQPITVKKAVPLRDSQGGIVNDELGNTIPRSTTIYDAASQLFVRKPGDENPIPILCHREHMQPVGVCRICVVEVFRTVDGKRRGSGSLVPACHHRVEEGMEVQTIESPNDAEAGARIRASVKVLTELLVADHLSDEAMASAAAGDVGGNELAALASRLGISASRFQRRTLDRGSDLSSLSIAVDHNACILCERCMRGCTEIKENYVIGRTGKGYSARIGFDLDAPMGESSCVSCGECMISCPTDALMFRREVAAEPAREQGASSVTAEELSRMPMFAGVPYKFLDWNSNSVVRQKLNPGDVLCREGEYGREAFLLLRGEFDVTNRSTIGKAVKEPVGGAWGWFGRLRNTLVPSNSAEHQSPNQSALYPGSGRIRLTADDVIIGEMTCMNHYPRSATVKAATEAEVLRINRNVLYMLQRNEAARRILDEVYRKRVLDNQLGSIALLQSLTPEQRTECTAYLKDKVELTRVDPGQTIFTQSEVARDFFIVRLGFVKVSQTHGGQQRVLSYLGPGSHFGEIGVLSVLTEELSAYLPPGFDGRRTASCSALDDVELVRIRGEHFRELWRRYPSIRESFIDYCTRLLERDQQEQATIDTPLPQFLDQGLFNAQKLLVLDLEACTRCDECTKACSDTHEGVTRLIREGLRFDKWLVASSCRSCLDPYCLVGCPVDAIHREGSMEIRIENHCIGCQQCAKNCPYGNINMHELPIAVGGGKAELGAQLRATTCDLCSEIVRPGEDPSCVYACPHDAAFRMSGVDLIERIEPGT